MGIKDWFGDAMGSFNGSPYHPLSDFKGKKFAIDISIFMNRFLRTDVDRLACTCKPIYKSPDLLQYIMEMHKILSKSITPVYVFDGFAPDAKKGTKKKRTALIAESGKAWLKVLERAVKDESAVFTEEEIAEATAARMKMKKPTAIDQANILQWMKGEGIETYGSVLEADQQCIKLEKDGIVDGIISEDGDEIAIGAQLLLVKMSRQTNGAYKFQVYNRQEFLEPSNPFQSKLCTHPDLIVDAALLLGNDYCDRVYGNGAACVLGGVENKQQNPYKRKRGMLDALAEATDTRQYLLDKGKNGKASLPAETVDRYLACRKYMMHAPVLEYCKESDEVTIVPLNPLPNGGTDWVEFFGMDFDIGQLQEDSPALKNIYLCNVLPLERKPLEQYELSGALFAHLDFGEHPIAIQPKLCLVNFLRARAMDARLSDPRKQIEDDVRRCLSKNKPVSPTPLQPLVGTLDGFDGLRMRKAGTEYDNWSRNYLSVANRLQTVTDDVIDNHLGEQRASRPSIQGRVERLVRGGHYNPKTIKCRNTESKADGTKTVLMCCECLSSKTSVVHTVYAVFEDKPDGNYLRNLSSCSCKKGAHFCSHSIGFLHILGILQQEVNDVTEFEHCYRVNPLLVQGVLMLIENTVAPDRFRAQDAQRKRQKK